MEFMLALVTMLGGPYPLINCSKFNSSLSGALGPTEI